MTRVLFVADQFSDTDRSKKDRHPGGAELTDEAAILACPWPIETRTCLALAGESAQFLDDFEVIVVGNARNASGALLGRIAQTGRHVLFEHDLRICRFRGNFPVARDPLHRAAQRCWCPHLAERALFDRALGAIFLTDLQQRYYRRNESFACSRTRVLGASLFRPDVVERRATSADKAGSGTCIFASPHAIKGQREALAYCKERGIEPAAIKNLTPAEVLDVFARSERFVYLPIGPEWAGRMVVEARLLGCEVIASDLVGVTGEPFWNQGREQALAFLLDGPRRFWSYVTELMNDAEPRAVRPPTARERALDKLVWLLHSAPVRFWPAGPSHGQLPAARSYAPW